MSVVIGYFLPMSGKRTNAAEETAKKLQEMHAAGTLPVPAHESVQFVALDRNDADVDAFISTAKSAGASKVMILGETLGPMRVETIAYQRGRPPHSVLLSAITGLARTGKSGALGTPAPVEQMAKAAGVSLSTDAGADYCNRVFHRALHAGLPAVFVHVNSGFLEHFRDIEGTAVGVAAMLGAWFRSTSSVAAHARGVSASFGP